ncbi:MAG TPA: hypothetical protein VFK94_02120 [Patescibacteria group bacterium]|nr:hypothetical protein [Patescibacteria group bacterium]
MALSDAQIQLLNFCEQYWFTHSTVPSEDFCAEHGLDRRFYQKAFRSKEFREALLARGVRLRGVTIGNDPFSKMNALTEEQLTVANVLLDRDDNRSRKKKLADLGVSSAQLNAWYRDPAFQNYLRERTEGALGGQGYIEADLALLDSLRAGDMQAVKYFNEFTGRYRPGASNDNVDVKQLLQLFIEVVQKHVAHPDTQLAIARDLMMIANSMKAIKSDVFTDKQPPVGSTVVLQGEIASGL